MSEIDVNAMKRTITTPLGTYEMDLADDVKINPDDLNESFIEQPSLFAWWATLATMARAKAQALKVDVEEAEENLKKTLKGTLDKEVRDQLELDGIKVTEGKVENGIYSHPKYVEASKDLYDLKRAYLEADADAAFLEMAKEAFNHRKESLISLGANMRNEWNNSSDTRIGTTKVTPLKRPSQKDNK